METTLAQAKYLKIHPADNVLVALTNLKKGAIAEDGGETITIQQDIPAKHKFFIHEMKTGDEIYMYGVLVGKAQEVIPQGGLMTTFKYQNMHPVIMNTGIQITHGMPPMYQNL